MLVVHALMPDGLDDQRRGGALRGPGMARLVDVVVDPGKRPCRRRRASAIASIFQWAAPAATRPSKVRNGRSPGQAEQVGEIVVGRLLPAGGPDQLVALGETAADRRRRRADM